MSTLLDALTNKYTARSPHMREIGLTVSAVSPSRGTMHLPARPDWVGDPQRGVLHPGVLTVLADSACGLAVGAALAAPVPYATLDLRMDWLRRGDPALDVHCEAHCFRLTRSVAFVRAEVWQDDPARPIASAQATFMMSTPAGTRRASQTLDARSPGEPSAPLAWPAPPGREPVLPDTPIPYAEFLGIRSVPGAGRPLFCLPFQPKLVGNPHLPALHGGVVAGFAETAALLHLLGTLGGAKLPKGIDFSVDYLRAGRPMDTFADCELVRVGARVALVQVRCWQTAPENPIIVARGHFLLADAQALVQPASTNAAGLSDTGSGMR